LEAQKSARQKLWEKEKKANFLFMKIVFKDGLSPLPYKKKGSGEARRGGRAPFFQETRFKGLGLSFYITSFTWNIRFFTEGRKMI
jgi:hypothetical protein